MNKKIISLSLAFVMLLSMSTMAFADVLDLTNIVDSEKNYTWEEFMSDFDAFDYVAGNMKDYVIEAPNGSKYFAQQIQDALDNGAESFDDAIEGLEPYEETTETELKVVGVSAITGMTIAKDKATDLKFLVNGTEELNKAEFDEKYGEEGYKVSFLYNKTGTNYNKVTGNVKADGNFKYAVQVTDAEGNKLPETVVAKDFADVKVADATKAVKVHELGLFADGEAFEHDTVMTADEVKIAASVYENALGQKNTDKDENDKLVVEDFKAPAIKKVTSSDPTVAYYQNNIVVRKDGEVTFTVEFDDEDLEVLQTTIKVTTREKQELTSIEAEDLRVEAGKEVNLDLKQLDQDGNEMRTDADVFYTSTEEGKTEAKIATKLTDNKLEFAKKGNYTVKLYADAAKKTELASFEVEAVSVAEGTIDYALEVEKVGDKTPELTLNAEEDKATETINLLVKTSVDGVKVDKYPVVGVVYEVESSDKEVLTVEKIKDSEVDKIKVTAVKEGTATVTLKTVEGDLERVVASIDLEVKNTTETIDKLTLKADTKVLLAKGETNKDTIRTAVKEAVTKEDLKDKHIAEVETVEAQNLVIVTITDIYGGKEFTLDAQFVDGVVVRTEEQLRTALVDESVSAITLGNDIEISELSDYVVIGRPVKLDGNNKTIFGVKTNNGPVLHLDSNNIEIKHVTIKSKEFNSDITAINIAGGGRTGIVIDDVTFENTGYGVYANPQSDVTITNNIFKNLNSGIGIEGNGKIEANEFSEIKNNYVENASQNISSDSIIAYNNFDTTPSIDGINIKPAQ